MIKILYIYESEECLEEILHTTIQGFSIKREFRLPSVGKYHFYGDNIEVTIFKHSSVSDSERGCKYNLVFCEQGVEDILTMRQKAILRSSATSYRINPSSMERLF